eukprot:461601-Prymnesium_polylepis.1
MAAPMAVEFDTSGGTSRVVVGGIERSKMLSSAMPPEASGMPDSFNEPINSSSGTQLIGAP